MQRAIVFVIGAALLALAVLVKAPASLVDGRIEALSAGRMRLAGATGTLFEGAGELRLPAGNVGIPVAWHLDAWPLLRGELRGTLSLSTSDGAPPASFSVSPGESAVRNISLALPADALLRAAGVPAALVSVGGIITLNVPQMARAGDRIDGQLTLRWDQATLQTIQIGPTPSLRAALGDVRVDATGQGSALAGPLTNAGGDVEVSGTVSASTNGNARLDALVRPRSGIDPERANAIGNALAAFGQRDGSGAYRITFAR